MHFSARWKSRFISSFATLALVTSVVLRSRGEEAGSVNTNTFNLYGTNFTVSVPYVDAGDYTAVLGFVETRVTAPGQRVFDILYKDRVVVSNLDVFARAGGIGKFYYLSLPVTHSADVDGGPLGFRFVARTGWAMLNSLEVKNSSGTRLFFLTAADVLNPKETAGIKIPEIAGPVLWKDASLPTDARVKDLISRMSLAEKITQLRNGAPPISRLDLPAYDYWSEALHGVARAGVATVFPQAIGMAATWDAPLIHQIGDTIATEARAKHNAYVQAHDGDSIRYLGLTFWTPNINLFRDPRWGRGQETYGEDPFLTGQLGVAFIRGLQGDDPKYFKALACAKHFAVHSGPESLRHIFDAEVSDHDLFESYLPQFEAAVRQGHVGAVMGAYNRVDGEPACSNPFLLTELLRKKWGFDGHVVSDCGAIGNIFLSHKVVTSPEEGAARALKAGCDLCCGEEYKFLLGAVKMGLVDEKQLDTALQRVLTARFRLGLLDPPESVPFSKISISENDTPQHAELALRTARESIVLLKNDGLLPLKRGKIKRIVVIGTNATSVSMLLGNYNGTPSKPITILDGIKSVAGDRIEVVFQPGCPLALKKGATNHFDFNELSNAVEAARSADAVIYVGGLDAHLEGEEMTVNYEGFSGGDRTRIELPTPQLDLLKALHGTGKPLVFVNCSGSAVAMPWAAKNLRAILQAWYPGEAGGRAVAEILFGDANPGGRLPVTFYSSTEDLPAFEDYSMANRTYRYFKGTPEFAFGHGLSYTHFDYRKPTLAAVKVSASGTVKLSLSLKNTGALDGDEVVQVYFRHKDALPTDARQALCGFVRVHVPKHDSANVSLEIPAERFRRWDSSAKQYVVAPGDYELLVGGASDDIRAKLPLTLTATD